MTTPLRIGLLGLGTVGGGVVTVLARNGAEIRRRCGREIVIHHAAAKDYDKRIEGLDKIGRVSSDAAAVVADPEVDIVIELIGGYSPARELALQAVANKKHLVTANKALIARHGNEIIAAARRHDVQVAFEAAVGGGIPILKALREGLAANRIAWVAGIINGTGNYILTEMRDKGRDFADALREAQALGYAEADPTLDVEGVDAAHKLAILAALAFGVPLRFDDIHTEGIAAIERQDVAYADELGYRVKHLGIARRAAAGIELRVHPALIPERRLLAKVDGVMNAILVQGNAVGPTLYYGAGAGALPTASAVVADVVDVARALGGAGRQMPPAFPPPLAFPSPASDDTPTLPMEEVETACYLRLQAADRPGVMAEVSAILGERGISIEAILQKPAAEAQAAGGAQDQTPIILLTRPVKERSMNEAIARLEALPSIRGAARRIRVETLGSDE